MDKRLKKLNIKLSDGWVDISAGNPNGPPTFIDSAFEEAGVIANFHVEHSTYLNSRFYDLLLSSFGFHMLDLIIL